MNETSVHPINSVRRPETGTYNRINLSDKDAAGIVREKLQTDINEMPQKTEARTDFAKSLSNISIHFNVDDETNRLIVVVTERRSGHVIRTIPASELEKMQAGELLKLAI